MRPLKFVSLNRCRSARPQPPVLSPPSVAAYPSVGPCNAKGAATAPGSAISPPVTIGNYKTSEECKAAAKKIVDEAEQGSPTTGKGPFLHPLLSDAAREVRAGYLCIQYPGS
jgi:hypothetical protein